METFLPPVILAYALREGNIIRLSDQEKWAHMKGTVRDFSILLEADMHDRINESNRSIHGTMLHLVLV